MGEMKEMEVLAARDQVAARRRRLGGDRAKVDNEVKRLRQLNHELTNQLAAERARAERLREAIISMEGVARIRVHGAHPDTTRIAEKRASKALAAITEHQDLVGSARPQ